MSKKAPAAPAAAASSADATLTLALKNASEKPLQHRVAGLGAMHQLLVGSWANAAANPVALKTLTPILCDTNTFLNHFAAINDTNITAYLPLYPTILTQHFTLLQKLKLDEQPAAPFFVTLVRLMLHPTEKIRREMIAVVRNVMASGAPHVPALSSLLLRTLHFILYGKSAASLLPATLAPYIWSRALFTIATHPLPENVALALFIAADPLLHASEPRRATSQRSNVDKLISIWSLAPTAERPADKVRSAADCVAARADVLAMVTGQVASIEQLLLSDRGLLQATSLLYTPTVAPVAASSPPAAAAAAAAAAATAGAGVGDLEVSERNQRQRTASVRLLLALFRAVPDFAVSRILPQIYGLLDNEAFERLTAESVAIWRHPEGTLCEYVPEGEFRAVAGDAKPVRREKDWTEKDEELERKAQERRAKEAAAAQAKKPAPAKGGPAGKGPAGKAVVLTGAAKVEADNRKKLEDQTALRTRLTQARLQVESVLSFFRELAVREPTLVHARILATLVPKLHTLFGNEIVRDAAIAAHRACIQCLDPHVRAIGVRLSLSVESLVLTKEKAFSTPISRRLLANTLVELRAAAQRKTFSPTTFLYIFPIVRDTITASADPTETEAAVEEEQDASEEEEFKVHAGGAKKVQNLEADDDDEEEEPEEEAEADDEKEEKSADVDASPSAESDSSDAEKPLAAGLQLSLSSASAVLNLHCAAELHSASTDAVRFPIARIYSTLLHILGRINTLYQSTLDALVALSSNAGVTSDDALPLLNTEGVLATYDGLRLNALQALDNLRCFSPAVESRDAVPHFDLFTQRIWIACHDTNSDVSAKAALVWEKFSLNCAESYLDDLIALLSSDAVVVRTAVGASIASAVQLYPASAQETLRKMVALFVASPDVVKSANALGLRQAREFIDHSHTRSGVSQAIGACTDSVASTEILSELFDFFISAGLKDMNDQVWEDTLNATVRIINQHGKQYMEVLLPQLEGFLAADMEKSKAAAAGKKVAALTEEEEAQNDRLREGVILSMGTLARHMDETNPSLINVVDSLIESLRTPSHSVQKSVAECLPPLMAFPVVGDAAGKWITLLLERLHTSDEYGVRKGAAFGLAGMVKGLKLAALKKYSILDQLAVMVQDQKSTRARQGALFAYERLFFELGNRFEPYVVQILPHLLACYGDAHLEVREAAQAASRIIMSHLTGHGIKLVLPITLRALEEKAWRTKLESIGLISAMAYCSPTQLSACLPMIVPRLLEVNTDANAKVQQASRAALKQIGSVIRNPEILTLVPVLLAALNDPTVHTKRALQDLMRTSFVHSVDPPSLALIIPILRVGLKGRTAVTKKMSAQVVGSMCSLIGDVKDILPYASTLLKYLKVVLIDPNPEVRAVAARALAAIYKGIESEEVEGFVDLREWLLETLRSDDTTPTIRSGCAQGLAQLLAMQGLEPTSQLLPTLFQETKSDRAVVREGFFNLFGFLPEAFQQIFSIFVADVLPVVIEGLADEIGLVREAALAAGQSLVLNFAQSKTDLLLPALEDGIINSDWRIRLSSVQLLGIMLLRLAGVSVRMIVGANNHTEEGDEADGGKSASTICTREQENHIESVLGTERRNRIISIVYLMRCDVMPAVCDIAFRVWKV